MRLGWFGTAGVSLALLGGLTGACLLDLDHSIACGDGYVDRLAGEECDPGDPSSYVDACAGTSRPDGEGACDPVTCAIINGAAQCATCGDETVDEEFGEECDGPNLNGRECPGGGALQCGPDCMYDFSECAPCGNDVIDEGEECDPSATGDFVTPRSCAGSDGVDPLPSMFKPYTSGETVTCNDDCRYDRTRCGYCGDGTRDGTAFVDIGVAIPPEWCDGDIIDPDQLREQYGDSWCSAASDRPNVGCGDDCSSFIERWPDEPRCCRRKSENCPGVGESVKCCYEYDHPDEAPCEDFVEGTKFRNVCK
jgi:hypothetical protein